uniref:AAR2 splicing factor homolog n=1 Tax=Arcella intermedia TaxID=1963864 RepID=A0A6B2L7F2_9EUKA
MNQDVANRVVGEWATLLMRGAPLGLHLGIDNNEWIIDVNFKGLKLIPPGIHFIYYGLSPPHGGQRNPRKSFWVKLDLRQVEIQDWDPLTEQFEITKETPEQVERLVLGVRNFDFDRHLGAYPLEKFPKWRAFTSHLTEGTLAKLQPQEAAPLPPKEDQFQSKYREGIPHLNNDSETSLPYTNIPERTLAPNTSPQDITKLNFDKSYVLLELFRTDFNNDPQLFLGEFEYAFLMFSLGECYESFEQWKKMLRLVCQCETAISEKMSFFVEFVKVVNIQVAEIPNDFFEDIVTANNFLMASLKEFVASCEGIVNKVLQKELKKLEKMVEEKFQVNLSIEDDEELLPTTVSPEELIALGLSPDEIDKLLNAS